MSAKAAFGTLKNDIYQSDYLNKKKKAVIGCNSRRCYPYESYFSVNKYNLIIGQYSKSNLNNVVTVDNITLTPVVIDPAATDPFYYTNNIDPYGELFGKNVCGILNYVRYIEPDPNTNIDTNTD